MRKFRRDQRTVKPRLLVLLAALVMALIWAQSETGARRGAPAGGSRTTSTGSPIAAPAPHTTAAGDQATPDGWGPDPFDPRPFGPAPVTTGR